MITNVSLKKVHPLQYNKNADFIKNWTGKDSLPDNTRCSIGRKQWSLYLKWCKSIGFVFDEKTKRFKEVNDEF